MTGAGTLWKSNDQSCRGLGGGWQEPDHGASMGQREKWGFYSNDFILMKWDFILILC